MPEFYIPTRQSVVGKDATVTTGMPPEDARSRPLRLWDERTGPEMFWLSILSLILLAGMSWVGYTELAIADDVRIRRSRVERSSEKED